VGDKQNQPFQLSFNASLKVDFRGSRVTSDGGLILVRELDERLGLGELIAQHLTNSRRGKNTQLPLADLLRQSVYSRIAGYEDVNDAERLSQDPIFRLIGSEKIWERGAALTSRLQSFETELLAEEENLAGLAAINRNLIAKAEAIDSSQRVVLDMVDSLGRNAGFSERSEPAPGAESVPGSSESREIGHAKGGVGPGTGQSRRHGRPAVLRGSHNSLMEKRLSPITLLGQEPISESHARRSAGGSRIPSGCPPMTAVQSLGGPFGCTFIH